MALRGNFSRDNVGVARYIGGGSLSLTRGNLYRAESWKSSLLRDGSTDTLDKTAMPTGYNPQGSWRLPIVAGDIAALLSQTGTGTLTGNGALGVNGAASLEATSTLTATGQLVVSGSAALSGSGTLSGNIVAALAASAALSSTGSLAGAAVARGFMSASLTATGSVTLTSYAVGYMSASIQPPTQLEAAEFSSYVLDTENVETGLTVRNALRLIAAATAGELSGAASTTITIRNAVADDKDRIVATVTSDGNRTAITYDLTDS
jgi:hypothetical protein